MIKEMRMRVVADPRGKITTGKKSDKGFPQSLDHFNIEHFPELKEVYGEKPREFIIYFPSDRIEDIFDCNFVRYAGSNSTKVRSCDGETCIHRIKEEVAGKTYEAGEESPCVCVELPDGDKKACRYVAYLKAWIADLKTFKVEIPLAFLFMTGSRNSGDNIYSEIQKVLYLTSKPKDGIPGYLRGIPFVLSVSMVDSREEAKKKFPIWTLRAIGMVSDLRQDRLLGVARKESPQIAQASVVNDEAPLADDAPSLFRQPSAVEQEVSKRERSVLEKAIKSASKLEDIENLLAVINDKHSKKLLTEVDKNELVEQAELKSEGFK